MRASYSLLLAAGFLPCGACAQDDLAKLRETFQTAYRQADARRPDEADTAALRGYLLYPYLQAQRLRWALIRVPERGGDERVEARVRELLAAHRGQPVTQELERDWLRYLGARRRWTEFEQAAPAELSDPELRCYRYAARLDAGRLDGLRESVLDVWLTEARPPAACEKPLAWLDTPERLSAAEIERRALFAARERAPLPASAKALPPERLALVQFWRTLHAAPHAALKRVAGGEPMLGTGAPAADPLAAEALLEAFDRVARRDSRDARPLYGKLDEHQAFDQRQRALLQRAYALGLAYDRDAEALERFELPAAALDALAHEWRVRAALYHGFWKLALRWLEAMPPAQKEEPRWTYWRARALEQRDDAKAARALYEAVAKEREYYAFLAAERLGRRPDLRPRAMPEDRERLAALAALPEMRRARELFLCDLSELAAAEFRHALAGLTPAAQAQAAQLAASWGWHDRAILVLSEHQQWDDLWLRFPLPYDHPVDAAAKDTELPPEWLYSVLRTESLYNPRAVSRSNALGLMQLLLPTARLVARRSGLPRPDRDDLFAPPVNIALGARYLRQLHERFDGRLILMLAGYNAGPQRVPDWLPQQPVDGDIWVENVPYNETRTYIQRALSNLVMLAWRRNGEPAAILPHVAPVARPQASLADGPSPLPSARGEG